MGEERIRGSIKDVAHEVLSWRHMMSQVGGYYVLTMPKAEKNLLSGYCSFSGHCPGSAMLATRAVATHSEEIVHERLGKTFSVSAVPVCSPDDEIVNII